MPVDPERSDGIDLTALAAAYRHRPLTEAAAARARSAVAGLRPDGVAIDIGGGTGMHAAQWAEEGVPSVVVDVSRAMLAEARTRNLPVVCARAQALPMRTGTCALAYFHLSIHYGDWHQALDEAWRVLEPEGRLRLWTLGPEHHRQALLIRYFPQLLPIDLLRFPEPEAIAAHLESHGAEARLVVSSEAKSMPAARWEAAVRARFVSTLQHLTDGEIEAGLGRFRADFPEPEGLVDYRLLLTMVAASR